MRVLLAPFHLADARGSALNFARTTFSVLIVATVFSISRRHVETAFIAASISIINFFNCSFPILKRLKPPSKRSRSAPKLFHVVRKPLLNARSAKGESIPTLISGAMIPVAKPLSDAILEQEFVTHLSFSWEARASRPVLNRGSATHENRVCAPLDPLGHVILGTVDRRALFMRLQSLVWNVHASRKRKWIGITEEERENWIVAVWERHEADESGSTVYPPKIHCAFKTL